MVLGGSLATSGPPWSGDRVPRLQESIDTTSSTGKLVFPVFATLAEFERDILRERTKTGAGRSLHYG
jgi:DNA invertase Pin-like site-specific DNA recombinase